MTLARRAGLHTPERRAACRALLARVQGEGIRQVRVAWGDLHGAFRGKTLVCAGDNPALQDALEDGVGMVSTVLLKDTSDRTAFPVFEPGALSGLPGFGAANSLLLLPDPASFQVLPWALHTGWLRADTFWDDGSPVLLDPRRVLQRALAALHDAGFGLRCGLEVEFHIYRLAGGATDHAPPVDDASWPAQAPTVTALHPGHGLLSEEWGDRAEEALAIVRDTALGLGLPLRSLEIELGPSQVEAVFGATDALTAADQMLLLRNGVRQALRRAGYHATFMCRPPFAGAMASGWHLHQSLTGADGSNAMRLRAAVPAGTAVDAAAQVLTTAGQHWLAGLLAHAHGMAALCAPTAVAYSRYQGSLMAPRAALWGRDNRGALLRVVGRPGDEATRIENRLGEPLANPYLCIAAQVLAGLDGLREQRDPGRATRANPYTPGTGAALPDTLAAALNALATDPVLCAGLGEPLVRAYTTIKHHELTRRAAAADEREWDRRELFSRF
jgi:glutamine synthetase